MKSHLSRHILSCFALLLVSLAGFRPVAAMDAESRLDAVTVYPGGAMLTRIADVELPAGTTTLRLAGLVGNLDIDHIRLQPGDPAVEIGPLRVVEKQRRDAFNREVERLEDAIRAKEVEIAGVDDAIKSAELQLKFLDGLAQGYAKEAWHGGAQGVADIGSWRQALALLDSASTEAYGAIRSGQADKTTLERDLSVLQRELVAMRGRSLASSTLEVSLRTPRALSTSLRLRYRQASASWQPRYEARLQSDEASLVLLQQAGVFQGGDEPWRDVRLSLSTSDPGGGLEPDPVESEFLDLEDPVTAREQASLNFSRAAGDAKEEIAVAAIRLAPRTIGNYAVTYDIPGRVTVENRRNEAQTFDIDSLQIPVELLTRTAPRQSPQAFLAARFTYEHDTPLYASALRVYVDGAFAGAAEMPSILPGEEVTLPMGDDPRVQVRLVDRGMDRGHEGIISRRQTIRSNYLFEITNRRSAATTVEVMDRYPVARNQDIDIEIDDDSTPPTASDVDDQPGVVRWVRELGPGESWRIEHAYTISFPADRRLVRR